MPIAMVTDKANEQHYEVPSEFYLLVLGRHLKYSSCLYETPTSTLDEAERAMLELYCVRAELTDGMSVLDLGCGWGSFSLFAAAKYPNSRIVAISNSRTQKDFIDGQAKARGLTNLRVITCDVNNLTPDAVGVIPSTATSLASTSVDGKEAKSGPSMVGGFDRIISIEMMEHMKNYERLLEKVAACLKPDTGRLFVHIFTNTFPYHFEGDNWMARYFFSGGTMPSDDLLVYFQRDLTITNQWRVNGKHYARTSRHWLNRMDANETAIRKIFSETYGGAAEAKRWWVMWRTFFIAVEETFGYNNGNDWMVSHYLFSRPSSRLVTSA
jgi:cyclopropane-fatty-acyl-phospholipid synthase